MMMIHADTDNFAKEQKFFGHFGGDELRGGQSTMNIIEKQCRLPDHIYLLVVDRRCPHKTGTDAVV